MPKKSCQFNHRSTPNFSVKGWSQGAILDFHKGRIAVFGEAAMFTSQYIETDDENKDPWMGLKSKNADDNENYYHRDAIVRLVGDKVTVPDDFTVGDYTDIKEEIKSKILSQGKINFKAKNNMDVFNEMTEAEWKSVEFMFEDGSNKTDIESIIERIVS